MFLGIHAHEMVHGVPRWVHALSLHENDDGDGDDGGGGSKPDPDALLKELARIRKLNKSLTKEAEARAAADAERAAAEEAAKSEQLKKQGEFEKLYTTTQGRVTELEEKVKGYEARETARLEKVTERNAKRLEALPESFRGLVPEGLDPDAASEQIARIEAIAGQPDVAAGLPPRRRSGGEAKIPAECIADAKRVGRTPKDHLRTWIRREAGQKWAADNGITDIDAYLKTFT